MSIDDIKAIIRPVLAEYGVTKAGLFGSAARGTLTDGSDIDILVELDERIDLLGFVGLKLALEAALGRPVDLVEYGTLKQRIRNRVLHDQVPVL